MSHSRTVVELRPEFAVFLSAEHFTLVVRALSGKLTPDQLPAARYLAADLAEKRVKHLKTLTDGARAARAAIGTVEPHPPAEASPEVRALPLPTGDDS